MPEDIEVTCGACGKVPLPDGTTFSFLGEEVVIIPPGAFGGVQNA